MLGMIADLLRRSLFVNPCAQLCPMSYTQESFSMPLITLEAANCWHRCGAFHGNAATSAGCIFSNNGIDMLWVPDPGAIFYVWCICYFTQTLCIGKNTHKLNKITQTLKKLLSLWSHLNSVCMSGHQIINLIKTDETIEHVSIVKPHQSKYRRHYLRSFHQGLIGAKPKM